MWFTLIFGSKINRICFFRAAKKVVVQQKKM